MPSESILHIRRHSRINPLKLSPRIRAQDLEKETVQRALSVAKAIANVALRQDVSGVCRVIFDFHSNLVDKDAQIFAFITILRPPNGGGRRL